MSCRSRLRSVALCVGAGFAVALSLTEALWLQGRFFPTTPLVDWLPAINEPLDRWIWYLMIAAAMALAVLPWRRAAAAAGAVLYFGYSLWDQQRWIPFFNEVGALLLVLAIHRGRSEKEAREALDDCGIVIALIYVWSGLQKLNYWFYVKVFPWMVGAFTPHLPEPVAQWLLGCAVLVPFIEALTGFALLTLRWRRIGMWSAIAMHAFILLCVGPLGLGGNVQVWFWNVASAALVYLIFESSPTPLQEMLALRARPLRAALMAFFGIAPILNFVVLPGIGRWDDFQAATLYSGNESQGKVYMTPQLALRLPEPLHDLFERDADGQVRLDLKDWAYYELNVPDYHAQRVHENAARRLCQYLGNPDGLVLRAGSKSDAFTGERRILERRCRDLTPVVAAPRAR
ncbi:MAG TPA: hypothetical protein VEC57_07885 [Candidatus Limnocylindrales bacterium]|nr:hypothetical protein [Candidatus Limnocylindrales bacterium]